MLRKQENDLFFWKNINANQQNQSALKPLLQ
jgi:hypothetical protein